MTQYSSLGTAFFGRAGLVEFAKALFKFGTITIVSILLLKSEQHKVFNAMFSDPTLIPELMLTMAMRLVSAIAIATIVLVAADLVWARLKWRNDLKMTPQEVKEEYKQLEGDPMVKARMRSLAQDRARQRMLAAVPKATFVIANPTHYAIALRYERSEASAPIVVAKGKDLIALKIRETAEKHGVPVIDDLLALVPEFRRAVGDRLKLIIDSGARRGSDIVKAIAMGADMPQTVKVLAEAEAHRGPSLVIAYSHCIAHGIDMSKSMSHQKDAVKSGYWPLYRFHPSEITDGQPFKLDSATPTIPIADFVANETAGEAQRVGDVGSAYLAAEHVMRRAPALHQKNSPVSSRASSPTPSSRRSSRQTVISIWCCARKACPNSATLPCRSQPISLWPMHSMPPRPGCSGSWPGPMTARWRGCGTWPKRWVSNGRQRSACRTSRRHSIRKSPMPPPSCWRFAARATGRAMCPIRRASNHGTRRWRRPIAI